MLRSARPLLNASARGLPKNTASIAPLGVSQTRRSTSHTTWRARVPTTASASSKQLVPFTQRALYATKNERDAAFEKEIANKELEKDPEHVTSQSSVRQFEPPVRPASGTDSKEGLKDDLYRVQEALALGEVPPMSYKLGLAGTIPYFATSLATVYCSWVMNTEWPSQSQFLNHILVSHEQAAHYLHLLEPIQIGYGAVIISFLGAIHWGMEYAEKHPTTNAARTRFRYGLGVVAPVIAWPTMLLPVQFALTAQFAGFVFMYFADTRASTRGWTPHWYGTYRFVLTFIVGSALLISLIGREKVGSDRPHLQNLRERFHKEGPDRLQQEQLEKMEEKEREKNRKKKEIEDKKKELEEQRQKLEEEEKEQDKKLKGGEDKGKKGKKAQGKGDAKAKNEGKEDSKDEGEEEGSEDEGKKGKKAQGKDDSEAKGEGKEDSKDEAENEGGEDDSKDDGKEEGGDDKKDDGKDQGGDDKKDE